MFTQRTGACFGSDLADGGIGKQRLDACCFETGPELEEDGEKLKEQLKNG